MSSQNPSQTYPMPSPSVSTFTFPSTTEPVFSASTSEPVFESPNHTQTSQTTQSQQLQQYHTTTVSNNNAKFPYLKKEEYETWAMKMEYWIMNSDHNLWNIVLNGNSRKRTGRDPKGNIMILPPVSVEEQIAVQRETKARTILLQSLPEDHMADFHHLDDARDIWLAVKARFGGNDESKKMRKSMLKQEFSEFRVSESEGADIAKITRKRLKLDKHGHGNGRAHKEPEVFYKKGQKVSSGQLSVLAMLPLPCFASKLEAVVVALTNPSCISLMMASSATLVLEIFWSCGDVSMRVDVCWVPSGLDGPSP
ncbi:hypothetical protein Tco_0445621 [Tanacetum coccineum]